MRTAGTGPGATYQVSSLTHNGVGRTLSATAPDGAVTATTYDDNGNVRTYTPPGKPAHVYDHGPNDLPASYTPPLLPDGLSRTEQYFHDADGRPYQTILPDGRRVTFESEAATGRLKTVHLADWGSITTTYGLASRVDSLTRTDPVMGATTMSYVLRAAAGHRGRHRDGAMSLLLLGMSHRTAPPELRERYAVEDARPLLTKLLASAEIDEAVLIATCNRVEVVVWTRALDEARLRLRSLFERELGGGQTPRAELDAALYELVDGAAVRHVLRVACALDSMVVGEPQILGQVKDAYRVAIGCGACGPILGRLYPRAYAPAKRVRNETTLAERPVSVARVAVDLARQIFESLEDKAALLVGAGDMIEIALDSLRRHGLRTVRVANRTPATVRGSTTSRYHCLDCLPNHACLTSWAEIGNLPYF